MDTPGQLSFFALTDRYAALTQKGGPLEHRGGPTSLDRFAAKLSYNSLVNVMPLALPL